MPDSPVIREPKPWQERYNTHIENSWVLQNSFLGEPPAPASIPSFQVARDLLPRPFWAGHASTLDCYWRAWELAFGNLKQVTPQNGFHSSYLDTAFNGNLFMWDSAFAAAFGLYGRRAFDFHRTLDNFYCKQHADGFICREICEADGQDMFHRFDPSSTGPNVLPWAEWNHYLRTGDRERLEKVFAPLVAYHQWTRRYRTWPDGSYWSTGWGCGMDNLPRVKGLDHEAWGNGHLTWVDATFQAVLSAKCLLAMAELLDRKDQVPDLEEELDRLSLYSSEHLWDRQAQFYFDRLPDGGLSRVKHIGAFWGLLAGCIPPERLDGFIAHLEDPAGFNRPHRVPGLSADDPDYDGLGGYWAGCVWAPTNYMVLKGLSQCGFGSLAHQVALNHLSAVVTVFAQDDNRWEGAGQFRQFFHLEDLQFDDRHTLWENYAAEVLRPGGHAKPGYVGWTGLPPIAVLFEDVFGLEPDAPRSKLVWKVRLLEEHGVEQYPFGASGLIDLKCGPRSHAQERPSVEIRATIPVTLELIWEGGAETIQVGKGAAYAAREKEDDCIR